MTTKSYLDTPPVTLALVKHSEVGIATQRWRNRHFSKNFVYKFKLNGYNSKNLHFEWLVLWILIYFLYFPHVLADGPVTCNMTIPAEDTVCPGYQSLADPGVGRGSNLFNFHAIFQENVVKWLVDSSTFGVGDPSSPIWEILDPLMSNSYHADSTTTYFEANSRDCFHWRTRNIYLSLPPSLYPHKHAFSLYNSTNVLQIILIVMCFLITVHFRPMC